VTVELQFCVEARGSRFAEGQRVAPAVHGHHVVAERRGFALTQSMCSP
jgi:hypothetical protein